MIVVEYKVKIVRCIDEAINAENVIYRLTAAVTEIVTNNTTGIGTVKLRNDTKSKIISTSHESVWGSGGVTPLFKL
jgi:aspartate oxidase